MRISKKDLQAEFDREHRQNEILYLCLLESVRAPEKIHWITEGKGESKITWGLVRITGAAGGYVIGRQGNYMFATYLDEHCIVVREASGYSSSDPAVRDLAYNESALMQRALNFRREALEIEAEEKKS